MNYWQKFCYDCTKYPCPRLNQLDKRYRIKYHVNLLENLGNIKKIGIENFVQMENDRWFCNKCGGTISIHVGYCLKCNENEGKLTA